MHGEVVVAGESTEHTAELDPSTLLLDTDMIGWFDFMYSTLSLEAGQSIDVPAFFPLDFRVTTITINVRPEQMKIEVGGKNFDVFVCDVPELDETDYVTKDGTLVKIERTSQKLVIELVDYDVATNQSGSG